MRPVFAASVLLPLALSFRLIHASPNLGEWVAANTSPAEKTVCTRQVDGELFFVAVAPDDKVRLGNRLDMTAHTETHGYSVAWVITNEKGESVIAKVAPVPVAGGYVKEGSRVHADNIEYQTIKTASTRVLQVEIRIEKCAIWSHSSHACQSGRKAYTVKLCEIKL
jgi:hypothetical protein